MIITYPYLHWRIVQDENLLHIWKLQYYKLISYLKSIRSVLNHLNVGAGMQRTHDGAEVKS